MFAETLISRPIVNASINSAYPWVFPVCFCDSELEVIELVYHVNIIDQRFFILLSESYQAPHYLLDETFLWSFMATKKWRTYSVRTKTIEDTLTRSRFELLNAWGKRIGNSIIYKMGPSKIKMAAENLFPLQKVARIKTRRKLIGTRYHTIIDASPAFGWLSTIDKPIEVNIGTNKITPVNNRIISRNSCSIRDISFLFWLIIIISH